MEATTAARRPSPATLFRLGRVSNLPTVWTNVLAAAVIAGADPLSAPVGWAVLAMTLFYVGGMYLNDAFDREIDARERPGRPIPSGQIGVGTAFGLGFGMIGLGAVIMAAHGPLAAATAAALSIAIVTYDLYHKGNPLSPVLMGACRFLVYLGAAAMVGPVTPAVVLWGLALFAHVIGLTYTAKQESLDRIERLWPLAILAAPLLLAVVWMVTQGGTVFAPLVMLLLLAGADIAAVARLKTRAPGAVPAAVGALIAGICLADGLALAFVSPVLAALCCGFYLLTRLFHRVIPGT